MKRVQKTIDSIKDLDKTAMEKASERLNNLLKPPGSLGKLEEIAMKLAGITGNVTGSIDSKSIIVMCSDNGVTDEKISSYPRDVSFLVAETMVRGISGVAVLAEHAGAKLSVVDIGLDKDINNPGIIDMKIRKGTSNIAKGPAMSREEALKAINCGIEITEKMIDQGADIIGTGEVGIGNTTSSSAVLYALTGDSLDSLVGRGAGLTDEGLKNKKSVIESAVKLNKPDPDDPIDILSRVGGFDIAGLVGCYLGAAARRTPVVIDGFISGVSAVLASKIKPESTNYMFTSHVSVEPGSQKVAELLGLNPMLDMNMRLGEGTGCALAFGIIEAATKIMKDMGSFADIGL